MAAGKRIEGESFKDYRDRLKNEEKQLRKGSRGRMFWPSSQQGTYRRVEPV